MASTARTYSYEFPIRWGSEDTLSAEAVRDLNQDWADPVYDIFVYDPAGISKRVSTIYK